MIDTNEFLSDELSKMVSKDKFVGWIYSIDYEKALIITNDCWKKRVNGIPHNSFLLASAFDPDNYGQADDSDKEVILLRVTGVCKLPQDNDMISTKIDNYQNQTNIHGQTDEYDFDVITKNKLQFGGLECRVLGTFYMKDQELYLGSDIESFSTSLRLSVFIPTKDSLEKIVNFVDPIRKKRSKEDFKELGIEEDVLPFPIGTVRYTSTDRLHRASDKDKVPFYIQPADFLARRTAVLGMTRTGKSNMIKQTVSVVKNISDKYKLRIGQLIFDINGEYANSNRQDQGSISEIFSDNCVKYRTVKTKGFEALLNNFYEQLPEGLNIIRDLVKESRKEGAADIDTFLGMSLEEPEENEYSEIKRWKLKTAIYKTLLKKAGYDYPGEFKISFEANEEIRDIVDKNVDPKNGLTYEEAD